MDILPLIYAVLVVLGSAIVRGYSGFGFSLLTISALSLVFPPVEVIASIFLLEIAASLHLLPGIWRDVQWRSVGLLLAGTLIGTPVGVYVLARVPEAHMRLALAAFVVVTAALLWRGFALKSAPGRRRRWRRGLSADSSTAPSASVVRRSYCSISPRRRARSRAGHPSSPSSSAWTPIGLGTQLWNGLLTLDHVWHAALFLPALLIGISIGARSFRGSDPEVFRKRVLILIAVIGVLIGVQGLRGL